MEEKRCSLKDGTWDAVTCSKRHPSQQLLFTGPATVPADGTQRPGVGKMPMRQSVLLWRKLSTNGHAKHNETSQWCWRFSFAVLTQFFVFPTGRATKQPSLHQIVLIQLRQNPTVTKQIVLTILFLSKKLIIQLYIFTEQHKKLALFGLCQLDSSQERLALSAKKVSAICSVPIGFAQGRLALSARKCGHHLLTPIEFVQREKNLSTSCQYEY